MHAIPCSAAATSIRHDGAQRKRRPGSPAGAGNSGIKVSGVRNISLGPGASAELSRVGLIVAEGMSADPCLRASTDVAKAPWNPRVLDLEIVHDDHR
jgi:hypothetical protein